MMLPIMWHAILRECAGGCSLRDLRGGAPKRPAPRTDLDYSSSTVPRIREGRHRHRFDAAIRYRSARCSCARTTAISCGIASLTRDDATLTMIEGLGGVDAIAISNPIFTRRWVERARAFTAPIHLLPRTSNGSCGPIQLSSFGTVRRKHSGTSSLWYATAVT
jgi:hypothetical protein